jgi:hypothetical protein
MRAEIKTPAEAGHGQGRGAVISSTNELTARRAKRKLGNVWREGRYLSRSGNNGSTVFDVWKWIGEPLPRRGT